MVLLYHHNAYNILVFPLKYVYALLYLVCCIAMIWVVLNSYDIRVSILQAY